MASRHCKVMAKFVGLGYSEHYSFRSSSQPWKMMLLLKQAVFSCPLSLGHLHITFPELAFKCTYKAHEDSKFGDWTASGNCSWKMKSKEGLFAAAWAAAPRPGQDNLVHNE